MIRYNTYKYPGKFEKSVTVFTGKDDAKGQTISIVGFVDPIPMGVMEVEPRKTPVDGLKAGKACPAKILVKNTGDAPMTVTAVKSQKFKATYWEGTLVIQPGQSAPVEFAVSPAEAGRFMDIIMVHSDARNDIGKGYKAVLTGEAE